MITEDYVSFETAKLLNEKGFDEPCIYVYLHDGSEDTWDADKEDIACQKPTLQMAMKWLREMHNYNIEIDTIGQKSRNTLTWRSVIYNLENGIEYYREETFKSYEESCEAAIKYCLENLI